MRTLFVAFTFLFFSCINNKIPDDVLPTKKMEAMFWDMLRADELADTQVQKDSIQNIFGQYKLQYSKVFTHHKVTKEQFQKSLKYYEAHPNLLKPIFDSLQKRSERAMQTPAK